MLLQTALITWYDPGSPRLLWYLLTAGSPSLELTVNARPLYGHRYTKLWCIFHVSSLPGLKHLYSRPYLHMRRTSLWEEIPAFVSRPRATSGTTFSDVWLLDTARQQQEVFVWGHERISSEAERWQWGNLTWEITKAFPRNWSSHSTEGCKRLNYSARKF